MPTPAPLRRSPSQTRRSRPSPSADSPLLGETEDCRDEGATGAVLRREGLYSSHLTTWRRQRELGEQEALSPKKRGRKSTTNPLAEENQRLRAENVRLSRRLRARGKNSPPETPAPSNGKGCSMIPAVIERCAGIDVDKTFLTVCVIAGPANGEPRVETREFGTFNALRAWLAEEGYTRCYGEHRALLETRVQRFGRKRHGRAGKRSGRQRTQRHKTDWADWVGWPTCYGMAAFAPASSRRDRCGSCAI